MSGAAASELLVHASCVAAPAAKSATETARSGVLIIGPSGSGKSDLALRLMALGATLVADDQTLLRRDGDRILAEAPGRLRGIIEARGVGLLRAPAATEPVELALAVALSPAEERARADSLAEIRQERLPTPCFAEFLGLRIPQLPGTCSDRMAAIVFVLAQGGALLDPDASLPEG